MDTITDPARRDRYRVHVHVDAANVMVDGRGFRLPAWLRDLICCDTLISTVNEVGGIPVSVGRTQRSVPERTRRLVVLRDRGCRVPGCGNDRWLHVHHVIHWDPADGGGRTDNLAGHQYAYGRRRGGVAIWSRSTRPGHCYSPERRLLTWYSRPTPDGVTARCSGSTASCPTRRASGCASSGAAQPTETPPLSSGFQLIEPARPLLPLL